MGNLKTLLESRFKKNTQDKMETLTRKRMEGEHSPFLSRFSDVKLSPKEEEKFRQLLQHYTFDDQISEKISKVFVISLLKSNKSTIKQYCCTANV